MPRWRWLLPFSSGSLYLSLSRNPLLSLPPHPTHDQLTAKSSKTQTYFPPFTRKYLRDRSASTWRTFLRVEPRQSCQPNRQSLGTLMRVCLCHAPWPSSALSRFTLLPVRACANQTSRRTLFVFAMLKLITVFPQEFIIIPYTRSRYADIGRELPLPAKKGIPWTIRAALK